MRIALTHVYSSKNKGDAAILLCQLRELERVLPGVTFEITTLARKPEERQFDEVVAVPSLMSSVVGGGAPRPLRPLIGAAMIASTLTWAAAKRKFGLELPLPAAWRERMRSLSQSDAQVCVGGGYLRGIDTHHSTYLLALLVHQVVLGYLLDKPVYLYAQSFGPFPGKGQEALFRIACACAALIMPRESVSHAVAVKSTKDQSKIIDAIDSAFLIPPIAAKSVDEYFVDSRPPTVVGLTVRQWLRDEGQTRYEAAVAELVEDILARGWGIVVIPQVTAAGHGDDDRLVGRRMKERFVNEPRFVAVEEDLSISETLGLYGSLDYLVGTRFHSVIFSLCSGVPCVAIEYEHKTSGILRDLGLEEWTTPIEKVTGDQLKSMFKALVERREEYLGQLGAKLELARERARVGANAIASHVKQYKRAHAPNGLPAQSA